MTSCRPRALVPALAPAIFTCLALLGAQFLAPAPARAQAPREPFRRFIALDLDLGGARDLTAATNHAFARAGAGLAWLDGQYLLATEVEAARILSDRTTLGLGAQFVSIESGLGATITATRDLTHAGFGAGAGVSFSLLNLQALLFSDEPQTRAVLLFLRLPAGLFLHLARGGPPPQPRAQ